VLRSVAEFSIPTAIARSGFQAVVDAELCAGCGDCLARCSFGALMVPDAVGVCVVDPGCCVGCGLCIAVCPTEALHMARRSEGEILPPPIDLREWTAQRAQARSLPGTY
jgi:ferredoxin